MTLPLDVVMVFTVGVNNGVICANHWRQNGRPDANHMPARHQSDKNPESLMIVTHDPQSFVADPKPAT